GDLRLVAGLDERLEAEPYELGHTAAEHGLFAEQVALGLLDEGGLDHGGERRRTVPLGEEPPDDMARPFGRDHDHVMACGRLDPPVVDVEAVREEERCAGSKVWCYLGLVHSGLHLVREQE